MEDISEIIKVFSKNVNKCLNNLLEKKFSRFSAHSYSIDFKVGHAIGNINFNVLTLNLIVNMIYTT